MTGFIYRTAVRIKDFGERIHCCLLITFGLWMRDKVMHWNISL